MGTVRLLFRLPLLGASTSIAFALWLLTRLTVPFSEAAARRTHAAVVGGWARSVNRILGVRVTYEGPPPEPPFFLVSNHLSYVDIPVLLGCVDANFLAKAEIASWPVIGFLARATGTLFIDRRMRTDLKRVLPLVRERLENGRGVIIFPEGTSTQGADVLPFRSSLFDVPARTELPVRAASLWYRTPEGAPPANLSVCWWGDMEFAPHLVDLLKLPSIDARVRFGERALRSADRRELAERSWAEVRELFESVTDAPLAEPPRRGRGAAAPADARNEEERAADLREARPE